MGMQKLWEHPVRQLLVCFYYRYFQLGPTEFFVCLRNMLVLTFEEGKCRENFAAENYY